MCERDKSKSKRERERADVCESGDVQPRAHVAVRSGAFARSDAQLARGALLLLLPLLLLPSSLLPKIHIFFDGFSESSFST